MKIVTVERMRRLERRADAAGVSYAQMMEAAGRAVAEAVEHLMGARKGKTLVLVGPGNNGGDGLVAARCLRDAGVEVSLYLWNRRTDGDSHFARAQERGIPCLHAADDPDCAGLRAQLDESRIVVDALLGTGANRPIEGALRQILLAVKAVAHPPTRNAQSPIVVAVDLPSGLNADSGALDPATVAADLTVTFACPKAGFYKFPAADALGKLIIANIGIAEEFTREVGLNLATTAEISALLPERPRDGHKGTFGKAMIVAGSANYTGAPYLSAAAAARAGAGLVTLATTGDVQRVVAGSFQEGTYLLLPASAGAIAAHAARALYAALDGYDALLMGPGLGRAETTRRFVYRTLDALAAQSKPLPLVVDADGLNALSARGEWWKHLPPRGVLTPHTGEFARLSSLSAAEIQADREGCARVYAARWNQIVLLKGAFTLVAEPDGPVTLLPFANPALATAGSGDVLAGVIAGLLAQGLAARDAAVAGGFIHGMAGEMARDEIGDAGVIAGDLLTRIPRAIRAIVGAKHPLMTID